MTGREEFGIRLRCVRLEAGMTLEELADRMTFLGKLMTKNQLALVERGERKVTISELMVLMDIFGDVVLKLAQVYLKEEDEKNG